MHLEAAAVGLDDAHHAAQPPSRAAVEVEVTQRDASLLAELEEREAHVEVEGKVVHAHLIEHRRSAVTVGKRAKLPGELLAVARRTDRVDRKSTRLNSSH